MKLKSLLNEIILFEISLDQIKTQFVDTGKLSPQDFEQIKDASGGDSAYATWLTARVVGSKRQRPIIKSEDIYKYKNYLAIFKSRRREFPFTDINQIKSPQDLSQFISTAVDLRNQEEEDPSKIKGVSKQEKYSKFKIGEVSGFTVYKIPQNSKDYNVSCELGSGTEWCTATGKTKKYFKEYISKGPLYIFDNGRGEKYQFHYESGQFMDKNDNSVLHNLKPLIKQFFEYLEDKEGQKIPLGFKLLNPEEFKITPTDLKVKGDLNLIGPKITSLPDNLEIGNNLNLASTKITSLPNNLKVGGDFNLDFTSITSLPDNLKVRHNLSLVKAPITSLPDNLEVGNNLNLASTKITSLPNNLKVGGYLNLHNTPLSSKTEAEIRQMAPKIKGTIYGLR